MAQKRNTKRKRKLKVGNLIISVLIVLVLVVGFKYWRNLKPTGSDNTPISFEVQYGESGKNICNQLKEKGLVRDSNLTYFYAKTKHLDAIKAGDYELNKTMSLHEILSVLNDPHAAKQNVASVTIVEGDWAKHIASKIAEKTNVSEEELLKLWNDEEWLKSIMDKYPFLTDAIFKDGIRIKLEGYLAPNTYQFFTETTAKDVTLKILDQTKQVYDQLESSIKESNLSVSEIYTLASIVQFEAGKEEDMKKIAGVFYNRLAKDMPLQSSVTVCYAIDYNRSDNWQKCEVNSHFESPYNTYKYKGLPPGPIENPGITALEAVLNPDHNDYLFFMADVKGDGTVYYAKTLKEHNANVAKYLK